MSKVFVWFCNPLPTSLRAGVRLEVVSELLTHVSVQTTADTYAHLDADDLADELARVGFRTAR
jgi:integrase/recombinase XerD